MALLEYLNSIGYDILLNVSFHHRTVFRKRFLNADISVNHLMALNEHNDNHNDNAVSFTSFRTQISTHGTLDLVSWWISAHTNFGFTSFGHLFSVSEEGVGWCV